MSLVKFLATLEEVSDPSEETFLLFSQSLPSQDLGFVDPKATVLHLEVAGKDLTITQSPTLLSSNREGGTTGAVVWKITPLFAEWIASSTNCLFQNSIIDSSSTIVELGCGTSGILGLALAPRVANYVATDQRYVEKLLNLNIHCNTSQSTGLRERTPKIKNHQKATKPGRSTNLNFLTLDWETDSALSLPSVLVDSKRAEDHTINIVLACDCIYNETLIAPLVRTCAEICQGVEAKPSKMPTICVIAQQLRSPDVFEAWLTSFSEVFRVWRVPDSLLSDELNKDSGFAVHIGINRSREMQ